MLAVRFLASVVAALVATMVSLAVGYSGLTSIAAYFLGGAVGFLGSGAVGVSLHHLSQTPPMQTPPMWQNDDPFFWSRIVRNAAEEASQGPNPKVLHYDSTTNLQSSPGLRGDPRLQLIRAQEKGSWPEEVPEDLRLRLLDATSYASCGPDDIWDEVRTWLSEQSIMRGPAAKVPPSVRTGFVSSLPTVPPPTQG